MEFPLMLLLGFFSSFFFNTNMELYAMNILKKIIVL